MTCAFCELPDIQNRVIFRNKLVWAFPSNKPIGLSHILICPVRCVPTWDELTADEQKAIFSLIDLLKPALRQSYQSEGFNYAWNEGAVAGQSVPHFHFHLIARKTGDTARLGYDPRELLYRPATEEEELSQTELVTMAKLIQHQLS